MNPFDPSYILFKQPLYNPIILNPDVMSGFLALMKFDGQVEEYNITLKENTSYKVVKKPSDTPIFSNIDIVQSYVGVVSFKLKCVRTQKDAYVFFKIEQVTKANDLTLYKIEKIGQTPSIADIEIGQLKDYSKVLNKEKLSEFSKAIGLVSHGVGIGSFVYLRRIFEYLIEDAHQKIKDADWNESNFVSARMNEKIDLLKNYLPEFLVENRNLYGILSNGVHNLTEDECLEHFEAVKIGIELILDEKLDAYNKAKKVEEAKKKLQAVEQRVK